MHRAPARAFGSILACTEVGEPVDGLAAVVVGVLVVFDLPRVPFDAPVAQQRVKGGAQPQPREALARRQRVEVPLDQQVPDAAERAREEQPRQQRVLGALDVALEQRRRALPQHRVHHRGEVDGPHAEGLARLALAAARVGARDGAHERGGLGVGRRVEGGVEARLARRRGRVEAHGAVAGAHQRAQAGGVARLRLKGVDLQAAEQHPAPRRAAQQPARPLAVVGPDVEDDAADARGLLEHQLVEERVDHVLAVGGRARGRGHGKGEHAAAAASARGGGRTRRRQ